MPVFTTVLYPNEEGAIFNMDYFLGTHLPLAMKHWEQYGCQGYEVTQFDAMGGQKPMYSVQMIMKWEKPESLVNVMQGPDWQVVIDDVPNFTSVPGVYMTGEVKGSR